MVLEKLTAMLSKGGGTKMANSKTQKNWKVQQQEDVKSLN